MNIDTDTKDNRIAELQRVRCHPDEKKRWKEKAKQGGFSSFSEFVRCALDDAVIVVRDALSDKETVRHLIAIGNNLNQLTRKSHIHDQLTKSQIDLLERVLGKLETVLDRMLSNGS